MMKLSKRVARKWVFRCLRTSAVTGPERCQNCRGTGFVNLGDCPECGGTGVDPSKTPSANPNAFDLSKVGEGNGKFQLHSLRLKPESIGEPFADYEVSGVSTSGVPFEGTLGVEFDGRDVEWEGTDFDVLGLDFHEEIQGPLLDSEYPIYKSPEYSEAFNAWDANL